MPSAPERQLAIQQAKNLLAQNPLFLDTETTGLDERAQIIEVSILDAAGNVCLDSLVKPRGKIPVEVQRIHGIRDADVKDAPTWLELWPKVERVVAGRVIATYNAEFDMKMMRQDHYRHHIPWTLSEDAFVCLMKLYARFKGEWNPKYGNYRWHSLEAAAGHCDLEIHNMHRAEDDARLARDLLYYMANQK